MKILQLQMLLLFLAIISFDSVHAQVIFEFENDNIDQWQTEGDGDLVYDSINGNPGGCLRVNDNATGAINVVVCPHEMLGDWSMATTFDSIRYDYYVGSSDPDTIANPPFVFEISGPAGSARALYNYQYDSRNSWETVGVPLDPAAWYEINGNWNDIIQFVDLLKIRAEFVNGDEYILIDNVAITFSPELNNLNGQICSHFDELGGWSFDEVASVTIDGFGRPENSVRIGDQGGAYSKAYPPPIYLGDWTMLDSTDRIAFDIYIQSNDPDLDGGKDLIELSRGVNSAKVTLTAAEIDSAYNQWHRYSYPIDSSHWQVTSGSWDDLMQNVTNVTLHLEFIIGTETIYMDNFCIGKDSCPQSIFLKNVTLDSSITASDFIILDSVLVSDNLIISAPNVTLRNVTEIPLTKEVEVNTDGCD